MTVLLTFFSIYQNHNSFQISLACQVCLERTMFFFQFPIEIIERSHKFGLTGIYKILLLDQDPAQHGRPGPDHQRVEGRGGEQGGRPVPRRHLLLPQIRPHKWQGEHFTESQRV